MNEDIKTSLSEPYFDRFTTNVIKGVALVMMFIHHFFTFPAWWLDGISYPLIEKVAPYVCMPLKLCVPIFCFLTGYFYAYNKSKTLKYSLKKISDILISYWCVFFVFAAIAIVGKHYQYTISGFVKEMFALSRPTMSFCWYVHFYIAFMLLMPLITKIMSKNVHFDLIITFICIPLMIRFATHHISNDIINEVLGNLQGWLPCVLMGYIFATYNLFTKMQNLNGHIIKQKWINIIIWLFLFFVIPMGRYYEPCTLISFYRLPSFSISLDVIYTPIFIYLIVNLTKSIKMKYTTSMLCYIGKYSLLMWFISCIFFNNSKTIFQPILYLPRDPIVVTLWGLAICFIAAYCFDGIIRKLQNIKNKVFFK